MKTTKAIKRVRAWAIVNQGKLKVGLIYDTKKLARLNNVLFQGREVMPVVITYSLPNPKKK